jgi:hypothetical protein
MGLCSATKKEVEKEVEKEVVDKEEGGKEVMVAKYRFEIITARKTSSSVTGAKKRFRNKTISP